MEPIDMSNIVNDNEQATHLFTQSFPEDVLRMVLEAAIEPEDNTFGSLADNGRLSVAYKLCLVNKSAATWIEPLLYEMVSLESESQVVSFSYTLMNKNPAVLSQRVRALWLFEEGASVNRIDFRYLFATLRRLENLLLAGYWPSVLSLTATRSTIRDLILVEPQGSYEYTSLRHLSLRSLHVIDASAGFFSSPTCHVYGDVIEAYVKREILRAQLEAIPRICLDFTQIPPYHPAPFVTSLTSILKEEEKFRLHEQGQSPSSLILDDEVESEGPSEYRSLWIKTNPIHRNDRPFESASETLANIVSTWDNILAEYKQSGPLHRPVCGHSLWGDEAEFIRIRRLPWTQRMKESIRYNELHWDRVARWCAMEGLEESGPESERIQSSRFLESIVLGDL